MRVLMVASELYPLVKTGGLADVASALPRALSQRGHDVRVLLPGYRGVLDAVVDRQPPLVLGGPLGVGGCDLVPARVPGHGTPLYVLRCPTLYDRPGGPYLDDHGRDWPDNHLRFALLARAAALLAMAGPALGWAPEVIHAHDWQAGLVPAYLQLWGGVRPATVITVHNLHFAGRFHPGLMRAIGLPHAMYSVYGVELFGALSYLKAGLYYADRLTTVSPTYAREIQHSGHGEGFQGLLTTRSPHLHGILNGIDDEVWDPARDPNLAASYDVDRPEGKATNKRELQRELGLEVSAARPLFGVVTRLTGQKGVDLVLSNLPFMLEAGAQLVVLGSGEGSLELGLREAARRHPARIAYRHGYDEPLSHRIMAGADFVMVPSRFEPCGLTQMYAMRYGALPIVRETGGLADTVIDTDRHPSGGTGFTFDDATSPGLGHAIWRGLSAWGTDRYRAAQLRGMHRDFGWSNSAAAYEHVYAEARAHPVHLL